MIAHAMILIVAGVLFAALALLHPPGALAAKGCLPMCAKMEGGCHMRCGARETFCHADCNSKGSDCRSSCIAGKGIAGFSPMKKGGGGTGSGGRGGRGGGGGS